MQATVTITIPAGTQIQRVSDGANATTRRAMRVQATGQKVGGVTMFYRVQINGAQWRVPAQYVSVVTDDQQ